MKGFGENTLMARSPTQEPRSESSPEESSLPVEQRSVINHIRELGRPVNAWTYANIAFGRDIEELEAEELKSIPNFLLEPYLEEVKKRGDD